MIIFHNLRMKYLSVALVLLLSLQCLDAKRYTSSSSSHKSKPSSSSYSNPGSLSYSNYQAKPKPSTSYGGSSHASSSYGGSSHSSSGTNTHNAAPIGWNVPKNQGPPPAYSHSNPVGGAKTNIHEPAPGYKPAQTYNPGPPSYSSATNNHGTSSSHANGTPYRPRQNSTGGFGSGYHAPIAATNVHGVQSSYPRQQVPPGATYYSSPSQLPAGATYHAPGALPAGATYHAPGALPAGATYHSSLPAGATYHPAGAPSYHAPGALPAGATYYPSGGVPHGASYYPAAPAAVPAGATYLPAGAAIPAGATYYSQPPKSSSGLGFGTGLLAGGLGGAILGHALTPTHTQTVVSPGVASNGNRGEDHVIIINNGPPGSVTTTDTGHGTTVINTGGAAPAAPAPAQAQAPAPAQVPAAAPVAPAAETSVPLAPLNPVAAPAIVNAGTDNTPLAAQNQPAAPPAAPPAAGGIICLPVRVPEPDPADSTKTIEVEKVACYPAPPPENSTVAAESSSAASTTMVAGTTTPAQVSEGMVPLAPLAPQNDRLSAAALSEQSGLKVSNTASSLSGLLLPLMMTIFVSYCLQ